MYNNPTAVFRGELTDVVEEARMADKGLIASKVLPIKNVERQEGIYPKFTITESGLLQAHDTIREPKGAYGRIERSWTSQTYKCADHGLEEVVDDVDVKRMSKFLSLERTTTRLVGRMVRRRHEKYVADYIMNETTFAKRDALTAYTDANVASFDVVRDIDELLEEMEQLGYSPGDLSVVMSRPVFNLIKRSTKLLNHMYPVSGGAPQRRPVSEADFAKHFGLKEVLIGQAAIDTSKSKGTRTMTPVWSNNYIFFGQLKSGDFEEGGVGRTIVWSKDSPSGLQTVETYRNEEIRSDIIRVRMHRDLSVIDSLAGKLLKTNYA